jgi:hypothetical protein
MGNFNPRSEMTELRDSPIFIAGHPKSGTSLLRSLLDSHPELITYPEETNFFRSFLPKITGASLPEKLALSDQVLTHIFEWNQNNPPPHQADYPDRDYSDIPVEEVRKATRQFVAGRFLHDGDILSAVMLAFGEVTGQLTSLSHYWVEKTPYNERYAAQIFNWWPDAKIIHTVRDPRDNFASYHRKHMEWSPEAFAMNWVQSTKTGLRNRDRYGSDRYLLLRFEDLTNMPDARLADLCHFLGIDDHPSLRQPVRGGKPWGGNSMFADQFAEISASPVGRWAETLKPDEVASLEVIAGSVMQQLSYQLSTSLSTLSHSTHRLIIRRLLSLTRVARSAQERSVIQTAMHSLTRSGANGKTNIKPDEAVVPSWRLFSNLAFLWIKELFGK